MRVIILTVVVLANVLHVLAGEPVLSCPAPRSPEHGQSFLYQDGRTVKFVCDPGHILLGQEMVRCEGGEWEAPTPQCVPQEGPLEASSTTPPSPPRPLFNWGDDNETAGEAAQGDEARLRVIMYPRRRAQLYSARRVQSSTELEDEERKRSDGKKEDGGSTTRTTIHLQSPPSSVLYVRRTGKTDDQETVLREQYRRATVHMTTTDGDGSDVQLVELPREPVAQNDKGEDALYRQYWWAHHNYYYPRQASSAVVEYRSPVAMTLSESQIAWINSLHPELRDQYLRDLYVVRAGEAVEGARAQAFLRRYDTLYPYYVRQPAAAALIQDVTSLYDYTCNQAGTPFIRAPKLSNAHIARYDRRQNQNRPHNHYLAAVYRCNPGYIMLDTRFTELYCSRAAWIGTEPICVPRA